MNRHLNDEGQEHKTEDNSGKEKVNEEVKGGHRHMVIVFSINMEH
jgi:hypothetical protein